MTTKFIALTALVLAATAPALAQTNATGDVGQIGTEKEAKALIGAPLDTSATGGSIQPENETLFFLDGNNVKASGEWTAADRKACSDSGGIELPISAGRVACIRL